MCQWKKSEAKMMLTEIEAGLSYSLSKRGKMNNGHVDLTCKQQDDWKWLTKLLGVSTSEQEQIKCSRTHTHQDPLLNKSSQIFTL